jgi:hypothetical protein
VVDPWIDEAAPLRTRPPSEAHATGGHELTIAARPRNISGE